MPSIIGRLDSEALRPLIEISIVSDSDAAGVKPGFGQGNAFTALIDTGATRTSVSENVVRSCRLLSRGKREIIATTGAKDVNMYQFWVAFQFKASKTSIKDEAFFTMGPELHRSASTKFDVLLGRDIPRFGTLIMSQHRYYELNF